MNSLLIPVYKFSVWLHMQSDLLDNYETNLCVVVIKNDKK